MTVIPTIARLALRPEWPAWVILALGALSLGAAVMSYLWSTRPIPTRRRWLLVGLRAVAVVAAMIVLLRPSATLESVSVEKAAVALVLDGTGSMVVEDAGDDQPRIDRLRESLSENERLVDRLGATYRLERYAMDRDAQPVERFDFRTDGRGTDIAASLETLLSKVRGRPYAGVVLMTDGAQNVGRIDPVRTGSAYRVAGAPIYAVGVGRDEATRAVRDIVARSIDAPQRVFEGNTFAARARFTLRGFRGAPVTVRVRFGDREPQTFEIEPAGDEVHVQPDFTCDAVKEGIYKLLVEADPQEGELKTDNNAVSTFVRVARGDLRVLLVEGRLRYESLFLKRTLADMKDLELETAYLLGKDADPNDLPQTVDDWRRYAAIVLGDVSRGDFTDRSMRALKEAVSAGAGLAMIGGRTNYGTGFRGTPVAELLPVRFQLPDEQFEGNYGVTPSRDYLDHFIVQVDEDPMTSRLRLEALPNLDGGVAVEGPTPTGKVLLTCDKPARRPILVVGAYGADGRTAAMLADTTWKWAFQPEEKHRETYERLWKQLVLWLAHRDKLDEDQAWLVLDKTRYHLGLEAVTFKAFAETAKGVAIDDARIEVTIERIGPEGEAGGDDATTLPLRHTASGYLAAWDPTEVGDYEVTMTARRAGEIIGEQTERVQVYLSDIELDEPRADSALLTELAEASGGRFARANALEGVLNDLLEKDANITVTTSQPEDLWDTWPVLGVFLGALGAEWAIRKRGGLA